MLLLDTLHMLCSAAQANNATRSVIGPNKPVIDKL